MNTIKDESKLMDKYLVWKGIVNTRTIKQYRLILSMFQRFINERGKPLSKMLKEDLTAFVLEQREKGNTSVSIKPKVSCIKGLAEYLYFKDILREKQYKEFNLYKFKVGKHKSRTKALTPEEVSFVYNKISDPQLRFCFWVGENYGLRPEEYTRLLVQHINLNKEDPYLEIVNGKGDKDRDIPIMEEDIEQWEMWLRIRSGYDLDHDYIFFTSRGKSSYAAIRRNYRKIAETTHPLPEHLQNRVVGDYSPEELEEYTVFRRKHWFTGHDLRRTFATITRTVKNVDLDLIKDVMGHENIATTQIYLREKEMVSRSRYREQLRNNGGA